MSALVESDSHEFVARLLSGVPESDRVAAMERYIHATHIKIELRALICAHEAFLADRVCEATVAHAEFLAVRDALADIEREIPAKK